VKFFSGTLTSRLKKLKRHYYTIASHITPRKIFNAIRMEWEFREGKAMVKARPYWIKIETSRMCNLRCPGCYAHGQDTDPAYPEGENQKRFMSLQLFKQILDQVKNYVLAVQLYDEGEPLLNPDIGSIVEYAHQCNVGTIISSNFSMVLGEQSITRLVQAGLDRIVIGIDGCTQDIYEKTRVNGNLERVISNTRQLINAKKRLKSKRPIVEIQFVQKPVNVHQLEECAALANELGADMFTAVKLGAFWVDVDPVPTQPARKCPIPWSSMVIQWNGDVSVCPLSDSPDLVTLHNITQHPLDSIFNSDYYTELRAQHRDMNNGHPSTVRSPVCLQCDFKR
jgi:radical SAM protein with 4Fe4S-binding SPASM domain